MHRFSFWLALATAVCWPNATCFAQVSPTARAPRISPPSNDLHEQPVAKNAADAAEPRADRRRPTAATPLAVPSKESVEQARAEIEEAYGDNCRTNGDACIDLLLKAAADTAAPARKFAFFAKAQAVAVEQGLISRALAVTRARCQDFAIDEDTSRLETLADFSRRCRKQKTTALCEAVFEEAESIFEDMAASRSPDHKSIQLAYDIAASLGKDLAKAFKANGGPDAHKLLWIDVRKTALDSRLKRATERAREYARYNFSLGESAEGDKASAHSLAGRYLCIYGHDWEKGLHALAKSDQKEAKALAIEELAVRAAKPSVPENVMALAGRWWDSETVLGESEDAKTAVRQHAAELYRSVSGVLVDPLDKQTALKRAAQAGTDFNSECIKRAMIKHMPEVAFQDDGHSYLVILTPSGRSFATKWCQSLGGHLASITTPAKQASLATALCRISKNLKATNRMSGGLKLWIDGMRRADGRWVCGNGDLMPTEITRDVYSYSEAFLCIEVDGYSDDSARIRSWNGEPHGQLPFVCEWDWASKSR